eukprot:9500050-Pyramimonas_sp.AAC.1
MPCSQSRCFPGGVGVYGRSDGRTASAMHRRCGSMWGPMLSIPMAVISADVAGSSPVHRLGSP